MNLTGDVFRSSQSLFWFYFLKFVKKAVFGFIYEAVRFVPAVV